MNNCVWGNILIGGIIGLVIDMSNGSVNELQPKDVHFNFEKPVSDSSEKIPILYEYMLFERYNYNRFLYKYKFHT